MGGVERSQRCMLYGCGMVIEICTHLVRDAMALSGTVGQHQRDLVQH